MAVPRRAGRTAGSGGTRPRGRRRAVPGLAALAAVLALAAPPALAARDGAERPASGIERGSGAAAATARAKALIRERRYGAALVLLREAVRRDPDRPNPRFLLGLAALGAARAPGAGEAAREALLDEAIAAFRYMLVDRPELARVRLELARAFFHKRRDDLARAHFERVLAGKPHPAAAANVRRFLAAIRARKRWSFHAGAALAPNTNVGRGSEVRTLYLDGLPFKRDEDALPRSGVGLAVWAGAEYQHPLGPRLRMRSGGGASRSEYAGAEFDRSFASGHVGPRWLADADTEASLLASVRRLWSGGEPDFNEFGVRIEASRRFGRRLGGAIRASWHKRRHWRTTWLDGPSTELSARATFLATPVLRLDAAIGGSRLRPSADGARRFRHTTRWVRPGAALDLPWGITLGASARWSWTGFDASFGLLTPSGDARSDRGRTVAASVHKRDWTLFGFSPRLSLTHERRRSNTQGAGYRRRGAQLGAVRQF